MTLTETNSLNIEALKDANVKLHRLVSESSEKDAKIEEFVVEISELKAELRDVLAHTSSTRSNLQSSRRPSDFCRSDDVDSEIEEEEEADESKRMHRSRKPKTAPEKSGFSGRSSSSTPDSIAAPPSVSASSGVSSLHATSNGGGASFVKCAKKLRVCQKKLGLLIGFVQRIANGSRPYKNDLLGGRRFCVFGKLINQLILGSASESEPEFGSDGATTTTLLNDNSPSRFDQHFIHIAKLYSNLEHLHNLMLHVYGSNRLKAESGKDSCKIQ